MTKTEKEITNLILYGKVNSGKENEEDAAIELLKKTAEHNPDILWASIFEAFSYEFIGMSVPAMAAYLCSQNAKHHFNTKIKLYFIDILLTFNPVILLDLTEYIKSKIFGSGLGSRNQKLLRNVMERWGIDTLKEYSQLYPKELYSLVKLLHPRFHGDKAKIIENIANKKI